MIGQRFGRLVVIAEVYKYGRGSIWKCACDCGSSIDVRGGDLRSGAKSTCGCARHGYASSKKKGHNPTYSCWAHMLQRCSNPNDAEFKNYGARGIKVCEEWIDFRNFLANMGEKPADRSLDRRDNEKGYEPSNCYWATTEQQARNTRRNVWVELDGEVMLFNDAVKRLRISSVTLYMRIARGWPGVRIVRRAGKP